MSLDFVLRPPTAMADHEDVSATGNTITLDFWDGAWNSHQTGWHEEDGNKMLLTHLPTILQERLPGKQPQDMTVFVPLCGKTKDMYILYKMGYTVVGVEFSKQGIDEFFLENNLEEKDGSSGVSRSTKDGRIILCQGDLFSFSGDNSKPNQLPVSKFDIIWDRGSLEAINVKDRGRYADLMMSLMAEDAIYLINTRVYDKKEYGGPPLATNTEDLRALFGDNRVTAEVLEEVEDMQEMWKMLGISKCSEQLNLIMLRK